MTAVAGRLRAVARTPPGLRLLGIGRDRVVGRWVDELEVLRVRACRLDREGGETAD